MITALVPTFNSEATLRECLESLAWVDKLLVVDSFSSDGTLDICREFTDWILQHEYVNSASQKNWALQQVETEWVLQIDSDEVVEAALAEEIQAALARPDAADAYQMARKNLMWGKWVRAAGAYPDWQTRLFRTEKGRWEDREVHAHVIGPQRVERLNHHIIHHDLTDLAAELTQFGSQVVIWETNERVKQEQRWHWWDVTLKPLAVFLLLYVWQGGYRKGFRGFFRSAYQAFYVLMVYARLYESEIRRGLRR